MEHCPASYKDIEDCVRAGKIYDMDIAVRVNKAGYSDIIKPLELDAAGIIYPHCKSKEEAEQLVKNTKFYPLGSRPVDGGNIDGSYCNLPFKEYVAQSNENKFVMAQIEDKEAVDEIDEIVKVDGIDIIFIGPGDLSQSFGIPGEMSNSTITGAIDKIAGTCKKYNKPWGLPVSEDNIRTYYKMGARFFYIGADVIGISQYFKHTLEGAFKKLS
jgi:4-hydroxy-2-oxoheptanedioate aldolase